MELDTTVYDVKSDWVCCLHENGITKSFHGGDIKFGRRMMLIIIGDPGPSDGRGTET